MSLTTWLMRFTWSRVDRKRDRGLVEPEGLVCHRDIAYGPHRAQRLDVYRPQEAAGPLPVIVSVHGGGWVYGSKELYRHYCMDLARRGFAVVNFTYRLSPEHKFPCHLEDTVLAFRWAREHSTDYGLDSEQLFAVGDSAGGHLLALYCALVTNRAYGAAYPFVNGEEPVPRAVALNCGVYDLPLARAGISAADPVIKDVLGHPADDGELRFISPVTHIEEDFPPCYVMTANNDFMRAQPASLTRVLADKAVPYVSRCFGDGEHPLGHVFHLRIRTAEAMACNDEQCAFFRRWGEEGRRKRESEGGENHE